MYRGWPGPLAADVETEAVHEFVIAARQAPPPQLLASTAA
jgi:hypothetical protein